MGEAQVVCTQTYLGTHRVTVGTRAAIVGGIGEGIRVKLRIVEPAQGTELTVGETYDVPKEDMRFWSAAPASEPAWDDDRSKQRQRHPADPEFGPRASV